MQTLLAAIAVTAGALGVLYALLTRGRAALDNLRRRGGLVPFALTALAPLCAALLAAPARPPFAVGFDLGWGILLGGALGLLVAFDAAADDDRPGLRAVAPLAAAALGPALLVLRFHGDPTAAVAGCALGAVAVMIAGSLLFRARRELPPLYRAVEFYGLTTVAVVAAVRLAIEHFPRSVVNATAGGYWALPALSVAVAALVLVLIAGRREGSPWLTGLQAAVCLPLVAVVLQARLLPVHVWPVEIIGLAALGITAGVLAFEERQGVARPLATTFGLLLVAITAAGLAFRLLHGFGEAMALLPAVVLLGTAYVGSPHEEEPLAPALGMSAAGMLAVFILARLLFEQYGYSQALDFQRFYDALALLIGATLPFLPAALLITHPSPTLGRGAGESASLRSLLMLAFAIAVVPAAVALLWGVKTLTGLLLGGVVGMMAWLLLTAWSTGDDRRRALATAPAGMMLALTLVAVHVVPRLLVQELTRGQKIMLVVIIAGVAVVWVAVDNLLRARRNEVSHVEA